MTNESLTNNAKLQVSIIIPTYNESSNILNMLGSLTKNIPHSMFVEALVVDDNSPDGTGKIVEQYIKNTKKTSHFIVDIIHRKKKSGLGSAIMSGIERAKGNILVVMDSDLSHPPEVIPKMIEALKNFNLVIASRYIKGGKIIDWSIKRRLLSKLATKIATVSLDIDTHDPMSGFFAFRRRIINELKIDAIGYKILLEILVKLKDVRIKEIPYTFQDRQKGSSKLTIPVVLDYVKSVWSLYRHKRTKSNESRNSIHFLSKAGRFFTVGASGFLLNYLISTLLVTSSIGLWYVYANILGIIFSMSSNFLFNKIWTFEDRNFSLRSITQYGKFMTFSSVGALIQLCVVYYLVDVLEFSYSYALILAVLTAAMGNFVLNKRLTFNEKIWS